MATHVARPARIPDFHHAARAACVSGIQRCLHVHFLTAGRGRRRQLIGSHSDRRRGIPLLYQLRSYDIDQAVGRVPGGQRSRTATSWSDYVGFG